MEPYVVSADDESLRYKCIAVCSDAVSVMSAFYLGGGVGTEGA